MSETMVEQGDEGADRGLPDATAVLVPRPNRGRLFGVERKVRLGDVTTEGRLRLDAVARYLQDIANDDATDSGLPDPMSWVVRKTVIEVRTAAFFNERLQIETFAGGFGSRWAERRTSLTGSEGASLEAVTLWVHVDPVSGRPKRIGDDFHRLYGEAAGDRRVRGRLSHGDPTSDAAVRRWPTRRADLDLVGHVNNAVYWESVEEILAEQPRAEAYRAEVEHRGAVDPGDEVELRVAVSPGGFSLWIVVDDEVRASARVVDQENR